MKGEDPLNTIIDGSTNESVIKITGDSNILTKIEGFTLQNGSGSRDTYSDNYIASEQFVEVESFAFRTI